LESTYKRIPKSLFDELIVVDDGSKDNVREIAKKLKLKFYGHEHGGYGSNLRYGLEKAKKADVIVEIHGDGQFDMAFIKPAIARIKAGDDFVLGDRFVNLRQPLEDGMSLIRFLGNLTLSLEGSLVLGLPNRELFTGSRAYSGKLARTLVFKDCHDDYFFSFEIIALARYAGLKVGRVPTRSFYKKGHTSASLKYGLMHIYQVPYTLFFYVLSKMGFKSGIFQFARSA
jgi:glycosyltransferase involved in cell wall biosynthesis